MKPAQQIKLAVRGYYRAFEGYYRTVHGMSVKVSDPQVRFLPGRGWDVNGVIYKQQWMYIVEEFDHCAQAARSAADRPSATNACEGVLS